MRYRAKGTAKRYSVHLPEKLAEKTQKLAAKDPECHGNWSLYVEAALREKVEHAEAK